MRFILLFLSLFLFFKNIIGQDFHYIRKLENVKSGWHKIMLPFEIKKNCNEDLSDIRLVYIQNKDTFEVPYTIHSLDYEEYLQSSDFKVISDTVINNEKYYILFNNLLNSKSEIILFFENKIKNWKFNLEGSNDMNVWTTIFSGYKLKVAKKESDYYNFSKLNFNPNQFVFFRVRLSSSYGSKLIEALCKEKIDSSEIEKKKINLASTQQINKIDNTTEVSIDSTNEYDINSIQLFCKKQQFFKNQVTLHAIIDRATSPSGTEYRNIHSMLSGEIYSNSENILYSDSNWIKVYKLITYNKGKHSVLIDSIKITQKYKYIIAKLNETFNYYLIYNNPISIAPKYDFRQFMEPIIINQSSIIIGKEQKK